MKKIKVGCFFGGKSSEYEVSLKSAEAIIKNMNPKKYEIIKIGITKDGDFFLYEGSINKIANNEWLKEKLIPVSISTNSSSSGLINLNDHTIIHYDVAFPILHGTNGEDGRIQALFEITNIPYVGCDMLSSDMCMDKDIAHKIVQLIGIKVPKSYLYHKDDEYMLFEKKIKTLTPPLYVKPVNGGSSIGITKIKEISKLQEAIDFALQYDNKVLVEEHVEGVEVGCAIMGNKNLVIGTVDEVKLNVDFFDFDQKYNLHKVKIGPKTDVDEVVLTEIKETAVQIYQALNCKGLARIDMFLTKEMNIVFNEVNTMPGFTENSRFPNMLKNIGYTFEEIVDFLIHEAMNG